MHVLYWISNGIFYSFPYFNQITQYEFSTFHVPKLNCNAESNIFLDLIHRFSLQYTCVFSAFVSIGEIIDAILFFRALIQ